MSRRGTSTNVALRQALLDLLAGGRATTTAELRTRLSEGPHFPGLTHETVYRHLDALARQGRIRRAHNHNRHHTFWTSRTISTSALQVREVS